MSLLTTGLILQYIQTFHSLGLSFFMSITENLFKYIGVELVAPDVDGYPLSCRITTPMDCDNGGAKFTSSTIFIGVWDYLFKKYYSQILNNNPYMIISHYLIIIYFKYISDFI